MAYQSPPPNLQSPSKPLTGSHLNFASGLGGASSRGALKTDLDNRVYFGVDILEEFLGIQVTSSFDKPSVDSFVHNLENKCSKEFKLLMDIANDDRDREKEMYPLLSKIFDEIDLTNQLGERSQHRQVAETAESKFNDEGQRLPHLKPDFVIIDVEPGAQKIPDARRVLRRQVSAFIEVKPHENDRPSPQPSSTQVKELTAKAADYGSLILSSRPFHVFAIGVVIFGTKFSVGVFDHAGILFSDEYDYCGTDGLNIFVRVIRRLTCCMNLDQLGHDPTVQLSMGQTYYQAKYPSFKVSMGGKGEDTRRWTTDGLPLWVSNSLFGRATSVWHAESGEGVRCVLKTAWRDVLRKSESDIYALIPKSNPGVADFLTGGDVRYPGGMARMMDIKNLRKGLGPRDDDHFKSSVLHRVSIRPVGKPLWEYKSVEEFIVGLLAILKGHEFLSQDCGILHRDISPGNLFLYDEEKNDGKLPGQDGFVADVELAAVPPPAKEYRAKRLETSTGPGTITTNPRSHSVTDQKAAAHYVFEEFDSQGKGTAGPQMTGTAQFMAMEVLETIVNKAPPVPRGTHHDLESIIWVVIYSIYKRTLRDYKDDKGLHDEFNHFFGGTTLKKILSMRRDAAANQPRLRDCLNRLMDEGALAYLVEQFTRLLVLQNPAKPDALREDLRKKFESKREVEKQRAAQLITYLAVQTVLEDALTFVQEPQPDDKAS
ncbi:hypothetical protein BD410DRAFT_897566 [Rickenella mellea]|uniref:Protein kinase domain-containing protein n=1 Tax=Rickenella mellea TaxID=50990 RepID=A0A4Y7Q9P1_9AGAM|nr:hypothetical protein BD410DRAFT_897566 [Rickenella mellea]